MYPPTLQEIADDCGGDFKTRERARQVIGQLVKKGYLKKVGGNQEVYYPLIKNYEQTTKRNFIRTPIRTL